MPAGRRGRARRATCTSRWTGSACRSGTPRRPTCRRSARRSGSWRRHCGTPPTRWSRLDVAGAGPVAASRAGRVPGAGRARARGAGPGLSAAGGAGAGAGAAGGGLLVVDRAAGDGHGGAVSASQIAARAEAAAAGGADGPAGAGRGVQRVRGGAGAGARCAVRQGSGVGRGGGRRRCRTADDARAGCSRVRFVSGTHHALRPDASPPRPAALPRRPACRPWGWRLSGWRPGGTGPAVAPPRGGAGPVEWRQRLTAWLPKAGFSRPITVDRVADHVHRDVHRDLDEVAGADARAELHRAVGVGAGVGGDRPRRRRPPAARPAVTRTERPSSGNLHFGYSSIAIIARDDDAPRHAMENARPAIRMRRAGDIHPTV